MTSKPQRKAKAKVKEFKLDDKFKEKYPEFGRIYTTGKNLILEYFKGGLIISRYFDDDITKTLDTLNETFKKDEKIEIDFYDDHAKEFIRDLAQILSRSLLQEAQEAQRQESQSREEQQQKTSIQEEIKRFKNLYPDLTIEKWQSTLQEKYDSLYNTVQTAMPEIWPGLEFELSVFRILNIAGCNLPFIGIILGRPSSYKTVIIELLKKWYNTFYTDNFTARSFVSHSTSVNPEELEQIDMLPRIRNRIFLTPELSPMFTTKEEDLTALLGIITRIADGHGYSSDSGAHGHRGYDEDIHFTWVGAAVDIPYKVYKILNNLGHRLYFYRTQFPDETNDELTTYATTGRDFNTKKLLVQNALFDYLKWFELGPHMIQEPHDDMNRKVIWDYDKDDKEALKIIAGMADLLSYLRCVAQVWETYDSQGSDYAYSISQREVPRRAVTALSNLARGHALQTGRNHITMDDVSIVIKTAMDSAQIERVSLFNLLLVYSGKLTSTQILQSLNVSRPTALRTMAEFKAIGLVDTEDFHEPGQSNISKRMALNSRFNWLLEDSMIKKIFPHTIPFSFSEDQGDPYRRKS
jgi:hypothetical protein